MTVSRDEAFIKSENENDLIIVSPIKNSSTTRKIKFRRKKRLTGVSKERRKTNERERTRLNILRNALCELKSKLPTFPGEKLTKIETIRLATKTIRYLTELLSETEIKFEDSDISSDELSVRATSWLEEEIVYDEELFMY